MSSIFPSLTVAFLSVLAQSSYALASEDVANILPLAYTPNKPVSIVAGSLFMLAACGMLVWFARHRGYYMLPFVFGAFLYGLGLFLRFPYSDNLHNMSLYSAMDYLIFISISFFVFGVFTLLGRLAIHLDAVELLVVKPIPLTNTLMGYQSVSFIISAIGAGMKASSTRHTVEVGSKLIITGILLQFVGLAVYLGLLINFVYRMWSTRKDQWNYRPNGFLRSWLGVAAMTGVCTQNLMIPLIYRVTAIGLGRNGALSRKEYYYYTSEVMTLWGGVLTIFLMTWPPRVLNRPRLGAQMTELSSVSLGSK